MIAQEIIIAEQTLETLFEIIRNAIHKTASPKDIDIFLGQVKSSVKSVAPPEAAILD